MLARQDVCHYNLQAQHRTAKQPPLFNNTSALLLHHFHGLAIWTISWAVRLRSLEGLSVHADGVMSVLLVLFEEPFWVASMKGLGSRWCQHESAHALLQSMMQASQLLGLLSTEQLAKLERCFTHVCQPPKHSQVCALTSGNRPRRLGCDEHAAHCSVFFLCHVYVPVFIMLLFCFDGCAALVYTSLEVQSST